MSKKKASVLDMLRNNPAKKSRHATTSDSGVEGDVEAETAHAEQLIEVSSILQQQPSTSAFAPADVELSSYDESGDENDDVDAEIFTEGAMRNCRQAYRDLKRKTYPKDSDGRSFLAAWLPKYDWLEYDPTVDRAFCYFCRLSAQHKFRMKDVKFRMKDVILKDVKSKGFCCRFENFDIYFSTALLAKLLDAADSLSAQIQNHCQTVSAAVQIAAFQAERIHDFCEPLAFDNFWDDLVAKKPESVDDPVVQRIRKRIARYGRENETQPPQQQFATAKEQYKSLYCRVFKQAGDFLLERFEQDGLGEVACMEELLLNATKLDKNATEISPEMEEQFQKVLHYYGSDLNAQGLKKELLYLSRAAGSPKKSLQEIVDCVKEDATPTSTALFPETRIFVQNLLILSPSTATAERSFSCLKRLKSYLRNTASQQTLNVSAVLNIHRKMAQELDLKEVAQDFVEKYASRKERFGDFK